MAARAGRAEMVGRLVGLLPLLGDDDIEALLAQAHEGAKRTVSQAGGVLRCQDPSSMTQSGLAAAPASGFVPGGVTFASHSDPAASSAGGDDGGGGGHFGVFSFGVDDAGGDEEPEEEDDEDGGRHVVVTETDEKQHVRFAGAYSAATAGGAGGQFKRSGRRKTVSSEVIHLEDIDHYEPPVYSKTPAEEAFLRQILKEEYLFEHLEDFELDTLIQSFEKKELHKGDELFTEGEEGDAYKILMDGTAQITESHVDGTGFFVVGDVGPGWKRGEEDLMYSAEAYQTVTITSHTAVVFLLHRQPYRFIVTKASIKKRAMYEEFLSKISFLQGMSNFERLQVADALKPCTYQKDEKLITFGDEGRFFFIITEGTVKVIGRAGDREDDPKKEVCTFSVGDCVGELEFVHGHKCVADVVAATQPVRCAKMGKRHFEKVMGPVEDVLKERAQQDTKFEYYRQTGVAGQ